MKRPQRRGSNGRFAGKPHEQHVLRESTLVTVARGARRGVLDRLRHTDPAVAAAHRKFSNELVDEFGGRDKMTASASALVHVITQSKLILDTIDCVVLELGPRVVNKNRRAVYQIIKQRSELADSLTGQLAAFHQLRAQHSVEEHLERLEDLSRVTVR